MIYVAGAGKDYCALAADIPFIQYLLIDADKNKIGKKVLGRCVYPYDELRKSTTEDVVYISSERYYNEIFNNIRLINSTIRIENLSEYIWKIKSEIIPGIINNAKKRYEVKLDVRMWLDSALKDETTFWEWSVKTAVNNGDIRLFEREFVYPYGKIEFSGKEKIVDVGCGPLPKFGNTYDKKLLKYYPVDPLAYQYQKILKANNVNIPVKPSFAIGELLSKFFKSNYADYVIMHNALDHCIDPLRVLLEMVKICKIGGKILLFHADAEGIFENYSGMHKWNITEFDGNMYIFDNKKNMVNVSEYIKDFADMSVCRFPMNYRDGIVCVIQKKSDVPKKIESQFNDISGELIKYLFERLVF